jgi:hypothetical protein
MLSTILQNLGAAFDKFTREPALIGAAVAFIISGTGNIYQYVDKRSELASAQQRNDALLDKTRAEVDKLKIETATLNRELEARKDASSQRQAEVQQYRSEIKKLEAGIASDEAYLQQNMMEKILRENKLATYESEHREFLAQAERQNLQITVNEIKRLEADKAERRARVQHLEALLNK